MSHIARHCGVTVLTCQPPDQAPKGGSESSVKLAKADIVSKGTNLRPKYDSFAQIEEACQEFTDEATNREHPVARRKPATMLLEETLRLHRIPAIAHTVVFGLSRSFPDNLTMITFENGQHSVPTSLLGLRVFVRSHGVGSDERIVVMHHSSDGPVKVARHGRVRPGGP